MKAAVRLQAIKDDWAGRRSDLDEALTYNRRLWTVLVTSATEADSPLPLAVKQNIANLGLFVFNHTVAILMEPGPQRLGALITINREIAAGLRSAPQASAA